MAKVVSLLVSVVAIVLLVCSCRVSGNCYSECVPECGSRFPDKADGKGCDGACVKLCRIEDTHTLGTQDTAYMVGSLQALLKQNN